MQLKNLTPHPLNLLGSDGEIRSYAVDGPAPRLRVEREVVGELAGLPVVRSTMGEPEGLPPSEEGVVYVVSALVAEHPSLANRSDLAYPGEAIRDADGKIVGAKGLCAGPGLAKLLTSRQ
jgi:hypothetical protein